MNNFDDYPYPYDTQSFNAYLWKEQNTYSRLALTCPRKLLEEIKGGYNHPTLEDEG